MTISKINIVVLVILVLTLPMAVFGAGAEFKFGSEPDGFRGINWGTDISTLKDMELIGKDGLNDLYRRKEDALQLGSAQLKKIDYLFLNGKLSGVGIKIHGVDNFNSLKKSSFEKFGEGRLLKAKDRYDAQDFKWMWTGKLTSIMFKYNPNSEEGVFLLVANELNIKRSILQKQKDKEKEKW
jgi:hypothetical protein